MQKLQFACEQCGQKLRASARRLGQTVTCPKCQQRTTLSDPLPASGKAKTRQPGPTEPTSTQATPTPPEALSSEALSSEALSSEAPSSEAPSSEAPSSEAPSSEAPSSEAPSSEAPSSEAPSSANIPVAASSANADPVPGQEEAFDFLGLDDYGPEETEWVVETGPGETIRSFDPHKVAIPRRILYLQGVLLAVTALFAFLMGMVFGRSFTAPAVAIQPPQPCELAGRIEFSRGGLAAQPDEGSVVIAVPRDYKPDARERMELEKIGSATDDRDPAVDMLRRIGGDFAITDHLGRYKLELPDYGRYFVLVLSGNSQRPTREELNRLHLSEMGSYFGPAQRLVGDRRFQWRSEMLTENQKLDILF